VILCTSDDLCGLGLWYGSVEGTRPDVSLMPRQHIWNATALEQGLRAHPALLEKISANVTLRSMVERGGGYGMLWEVGDGKDLDTAFGKGPPPIFYGRGSRPPLVSVGGGNPERIALVEHTDRIVHWIELAGLDPELTPGAQLHFHTQRLLARDLLGIGLVMAWKRHRPVAEEAFALSLRIKPDYSPALINLAIFEARDGRLDSALELARRAAESDPLASRPPELIDKIMKLEALGNPPGATP
jgi:tetratricopeptide (TPR) repeat protein